MKTTMMATRMMTEERLETMSALLSGLLLGLIATIVASVSLFGLHDVPGFGLLPLWLQAGLLNVPFPSGAEAPPVYWYSSRAAGLLAYGALWASTVWGLIVSAKALDTLVPRAVSFGLHQFLSTLALVLAGIHVFALLGDTYFEFTLSAVLIPGRSPYKPLWVGFGVLALYALLIVYWSFYLRKRIGYRAWRRLHYLSFVLYAFVTVHGLMAGTDLGNGTVAYPYLASAGVVLFLIYYRILLPARRKSKKRRQQRKQRPSVPITVNGKANGFDAGIRPVREAQSIAHG